MHIIWDNMSLWKSDKTSICPCKLSKGHRQMVNRCLQFLCFPEVIIFILVESAVQVHAMQKLTRPMQQLRWTFDIITWSSSWLRNQHKPHWINVLFWIDFIDLRVQSLRYKASGIGLSRCFLCCDSEAGGIVFTNIFEKVYQALYCNRCKLDCWDWKPWKVRFFSQSQWWFNDVAKVGCSEFVEGWKFLTW